MYRKYVLDRLDAQQQQQHHLPSPPVANTFPDNHLIVGEAQSKAARAGALHRRDSGARVAESGTYRSDRSDSGIESEFGGSKTFSGQKNELRATNSKCSAGQDKGDYKVELKSHRDWAPYKKPDRVRSEPDIITNQSVKEKGQSGSQCSSETPSNSNDAADIITDPQSESRISRFSSFSEGYVESQAQKRPPRHIRYNYSEVDLFDDFVSRDSTPEFRRPPKEITVRDIERGISQRVALSSKHGNKDRQSPSPVRLLDAHGCHDVKQELIVAKPIAEAAKGKPQSPMLFQNRRNDGFSRASVESVRPTHFPSGLSYASAKDAGKVLPVKDVGKGKRSHLDARNETADPKKLSPRYSNHLQGEHPWPQAAFKGKLSESGSDSSVVVGEDDQITYSWHKVNVYSNPDAASGSGFFRRKVRQSKEKHILKDVTGVCRPGELLAIMGASGAGKTTLLNVLTHRNNDRLRITGDLFVNGRRVDPDALTSRSAYVQQDDLFIGMLTVREQLVFQAMLRMDRHLLHEQRMTRVDEVISELGLIKCSETKIGVPGRIKGISGGEMKRLAFACEVLTNPPLMFCDEPTSGLDSFMAQNVVAVMKNMAERGKTIISTIHQPSSEVYAMFDRVLLMAEGRVAFLGEVDAAYQFFSRIGLPCPPNYNPADFFISTLAVQPGKEDNCRKAITMICDEFVKSEEGTSIEKAVAENSKEAEEIDGYDSRTDVQVKKSPYKASWWTQFRNVLWRSWLEVIREPMLIKVRFVQVMAIAVLIGLIYWGQTLTQEGITNINGALFLFLTNMTFQNVFGVVSTFCAQLPIFMREHFNGMYRTDVYFLSKMLAELPFHIIYPFAFVAIAYHMVGFTNDYVNFFICAGIVVLVANCAISFGYMISCMARNLSVALAISAPFIIPLMLFGGFFLNSGSTPVYLTWFKYLSWFSYGNEALLLNQWQGVKSIACNTNQTCFPNGQAVLSFLHYENGSITGNVIMLVVLIVVYRTLAFFALLAKTFRKQK